MWVYDNLNLQQRIRHEREGIQTNDYLLSDIYWYMYIQLQTTTLRQ